jgi:hypothetical protein
MHGKLMADLFSADVLRSNWSWLASEDGLTVA